MEINVDFTYEHSDLNLSPTKVQVLTGEYKDLIFEFNNSGLAEWFENGVYKNKFNFEYALCEIPDQLKHRQLQTNAEFEKFLMYLVIDVIGDIKNMQQPKISGF